MQPSPALIMALENVEYETNKYFIFPKLFCPLTFEVELRLWNGLLALKYLSCANYFLQIFLIESHDHPTVEFFASILFHPSFPEQWKWPHFK